MKKLVLFTTILLFYNCSAQVHWMDLSEALNLQNKTPKKIMIDFYKKDCLSCDKIKSASFSNQYISRYINSHFYPVRFNVENTQEITAFGNVFKFQKSGVHQFVQFLGVTGTPSIIFLDEKNTIITKLQGYINPNELYFYLSVISQNKYKNFKTKAQRQAYQRKFIRKIDLKTKAIP